MQVTKPGAIESHPLQLARIKFPEPKQDEVLIKIRTCGVCHTDLHIAEGELKASHYPITPGHQVVGEIEKVGMGVKSLQLGDRVGVPWLNSTCSKCDACCRGEENLCELVKFTGLDVDGGYAEYISVKESFALRLPPIFTDIEAAPLLCAGIIGFRALKIAGVQPGEKVGLIGFGASAHIALQLLNYRNCQTYVFTRSDNHRKHAEELGAKWVGGIEEKIDGCLDRAIIFAPAGSLVPLALEKIRPGGVVAINAVFMSAIPMMEYRLIYGERVLQSVANATRKDGEEFLSEAARIGIKVTTCEYPLEDATRALIDLKAGEVVGEAVLVVS